MILNVDFCAHDYVINFSIWNLLKSCCGYLNFIVWLCWNVNFEVLVYNVKDDDVVVTWCWIHD